MAKRLIITFPVDRDQPFYSRVLDFGEALWRPVVHGKLGTLCDLDKSTPIIWIDFDDPHDLGKLKGIVRKQLADAQLTADAVVTVGNRSPTAA